MEQLERSPDDSRGRGRPRCPTTDRAILDATLAQLAAVGFVRMSMEAVAKEAGTTKPTIYRRWPTKEALAIAALAELQADEAPIPSGVTIADLTAVLQDFRKKLLRPNGMAIIGTVLAEESHIPELTQRFRDQIVQPRRNALLSILEAAKDRREIRSDCNLDAAVNMLVGSFYARYLAASEISVGFPKQVVQTILEGLAEH